MAKSKEETNAYAREWRSRNKDRYREYERQRHANNPDRVWAVNIRLHYGVSVDDYQRMYDDQRGCCAICFAPFAGKGCIDHDHDTGRVRGLLCKPCNLAVGQMMDSPERLRSAADYLERAL